MDDGIHEFTQIIKVRHLLYSLDVMDKSESEQQCSCGSLILIQRSEREGVRRTVGSGEVTKKEKENNRDVILQNVTCDKLQRKQMGPLNSTLQDPVLSQE